MKKSVLVLALSLSLLAGVSLVFANDGDKEVIAPLELSQTGEHLVVQAVALNASIKEELEALREQKRLEAEAKERQSLKEQRVFKSFIASAKSHKFRDYDATTPSGLRGYQIEEFLKGTGLEGLGEAYAQAEQEFGISAIVLLGISAQESGWGTSKMAQTKNNLFGYQAYDADTSKAKSFRTKEEAVLHVGQRIAEDYLTEDGKYYRGKTLKDINKLYASDEEWYAKITAIMNEIVSRY